MENIADSNTFEEALKLCLEYEGGYTNDPTDSGGETNFGIIHSEYDNYRDSKHLPRRNVRYMDMSEAREIYANKYWLRSGCDKMPRRVAIAVFDWQVNSGRGVKLLQQCLKVGVDGIVGPITLNELTYWVNQGKENELLSRYFDIREACYRSWGHGSQKCFLQGWLNRLEHLKQYLKVK